MDHRRTDFSPPRIGMLERRYSIMDTCNPSCQGLGESVKLKSSREEKIICPQRLSIPFRERIDGLADSGKNR